jgi:hypothetical protein
MKNHSNLKAFFLAFTLGLVAVSWTDNDTALMQSAQARGGGGGGGGHGGGFGGYRGGGYGGYRGGDFGGMRDDGFDRGYIGDRGDEGADRGYIGNRDDDVMGHGVNGDSMATRAYDARYAAHTEGLSTDGGFGRLSTEYAGTALGRNYGGSTRPYTQANLLNHGENVRNAWNNHNYPLFDRGWWGRHNDWWGYGGWGDGWWGGVGWGDLYPYWDMPQGDAPVEYDYGNNITYQGDQVYYGSQPMATSVQYYTQAQTLANSAPVIPTTVVNGMTQFTGDWKPLGVFSLTQAGESNSNTIFQLAVNKAGVISGNYYNTLNNQSTPIKGKVDKKNMRVAFTVGKNKDVVYDTGLANLLEPQSPILVHLSKTKTQQEVLVKLDQPKQSGAPSTPSG